MSRKSRSSRVLVGVLARSEYTLEYVKCSSIGKSEEQVHISGGTHSTNRSILITTLHIASLWSEVEVFTVSPAI